MNVLRVSILTIFYGGERLLLTLLRELGIGLKVIQRCEPTLRSCIQHRGRNTSSPVDADERAGIRTAIGGHPYMVAMNGCPRLPPDFERDDLAEPFIARESVIVSRASTGNADQFWTLAAVPPQRATDREIGEPVFEIADQFWTALRFRIAPFDPQCRPSNALEAA